MKTKLDDKIEQKALLDNLSAAGYSGDWILVHQLLESNHYPKKKLRVLLDDVAEQLMHHPQQNQNLWDFSEILLDQLDKENGLEKPSKNIKLYWENCFYNLFSKWPEAEDLVPSNKQSALRFAITSMYELLLQPQKCMVYLNFLSKELERQWNLEHPNEAFEPFDDKTIDHVSHQNLPWIIPNEQFNGFKKHHLLGRLLLNKFNKYDMGETCGKWSGYIPVGISKQLLTENTFFTENRLTINGLFHGNMHNLQRVILLYAMEACVIPLQYKDCTGIKRLKPKEIFSALMDTSLVFKKPCNAPWLSVLDSSPANAFRSFTLPHALHSAILTAPQLKGMLQDYHRFSFCNHYLQLQQFHNQQCETTFNLKAMFREIRKFNLLGFSQQETIIQLEQDNHSQGDGKTWAISPKHYLPLNVSTNSYPKSGFFVLRTMRHEPGEDGKNYCTLSS